MENTWNEALGIGKQQKGQKRKRSKKATEGKKSWWSTATTAREDIRLYSPWSLPRVFFKSKARSWRSWNVFLISKDVSLSQHHFTASNSNLEFSKFGDYFPRMEATAKMVAVLWVKQYSENGGRRRRLLQQSLGLYDPRCVRIRFVRIILPPHNFRFARMSFDFLVHFSIFFCDLRIFQIFLEECKC